MTVDIRATVTCSLGTLISGSLSDDYLQGSGLIKTRGTVEIDGLITPAIGTVVTFTYTKNAVLRNVPRRLRVMSSFADPYRRTTKVELGCKLTYFSDLQEPLNWDALDDPENAALSASDQEIVTIPIYAKSIAAECCNQLGINPAPVSVLTNKFSVAEFDFSSGYVQILSDLLVSESYCGYLSETETLVLIDLSADGGTGPALTEAEIVDLGPIGVGQLPGEAVIVEYSTLKLRSPDESVTDADPTLLWEESQESAEVEVIFQWTPNNVGAAVPVIARGIETIETLVEYTTINERNLEAVKTVTENKMLASRAGSAVSQWWSNGYFYDPEQLTESKVITTSTYDEDGNLIRSDVETYDSIGGVLGRVNVPLSYADGTVVLPAGFNLPDIFVTFSADYLVGRQVQEIELAGDPTRVQRFGGNRPTGTFDTTFSQDTTSTYVLVSETIEGQQRAAENGSRFTTAQDAADYINAVVAKGPQLDQVTINGGRQLFAPQEKPSNADLLNAAKAADSGDPNNGWRTESEAEVVLALGSAEAQRRITFRMPYAPDDVFSGPSGGPFTATPSDAEQKAITYGRVQNRLLMGNRNGMNLQIAPEKLPAAPFAPMFVQANGLTALYRANGNQWAFSSDGIVVSTDALFWGAVGGTGTFWFPVAPGVVTLPSTPPTDGNGDITVTAGEVIPAYNETVLITLRMRTRLEVTPLLYSLSETFNVTLVTYTKLEMLGGLIDVPAVNFALAAHAPLMSTIVNVPVALFELTALAPSDVGTPATVVDVPEASFALAALAPSISTASIFPPVLDFALAAHAPALPKPAPEYLSFGEQRRGTGTLTFFDSTGIDAGTSIGDIAIIAIESSGGDSTLTPPSGWALFPGTNVVSTADTTGTQLHVWWKRVDSLDYEELTVPDGGDHQIATAIYVTGCVASGNPWDAIVTDTDPVADTTCVWPSITTTRDNTLLVFVVAESTVNQIATTPVNANLTNLAIRRTYDGSVGNGGAVTFATGTWSSTGASGTTSSSTGFSNQRAYAVIALRSY